MQSRAAASGIKLVAKARGSKPNSKLKAAVPTISPEEEARQRRARQLEAQAREKQAAEAAAAAAAKERDAQRQWILQYAEDESESDPDEPDSEQVSLICCCLLPPVLCLTSYQSSDPVYRSHDLFGDL